MMQPIDPKTHVVVDLRDCAEIPGAEAVDLDTGEVSVRELTYDGEVRRVVSMPGRVRVVRRR
jgi:hypothetical protein